jgi:hypothetical protein
MIYAILEESGATRHSSMEPRRYLPEPWRQNVHMVGGCQLAVIKHFSWVGRPRRFCQSRCASRRQSRNRISDVVTFKFTRSVCESIHDTGLIRLDILDLALSRRQPKFDPSVCNRSSINRTVSTRRIAQACRLAKTIRIASGTAVIGCSVRSFISLQLPPEITISASEVPSHHSLRHRAIFEIGECDDDELMES